MLLGLNCSDVLSCWSTSLSKGEVKLIRCFSYYYRKIVTEYEKTIAQMIGELKYYKIKSSRTLSAQKDVIYHSTVSSSLLLLEDEQCNKLGSQKALHDVTCEKEAALADLNSVERSLSDMFRRYENMKSTLEGFKKVRSQVHFLKESVSFKSWGDQHKL